MMKLMPNPEISPPSRILPVITLAQFAGGSLWFAINAVIPDLQQAKGLPASAAGTLSAAVQLGFVLGTLIFALFAVADRYSARLVFLLCCLTGAASAILTALLPAGMPILIALRTLTGFVLAGIYPLGMKIAASWFRQGLGSALGTMLSAAIVGTALPHALRALGTGLPWQVVLFGVAILATAGGALVFILVPDSPYMPRSVAPLQLRAFGAMWRNPHLRAPVFGYFGHMWELYTVWVLVPSIVSLRFAGSLVSWISFAAIAAGAVGCVWGGQLSRRFGSARVAAVQIVVSGLCCLAAPWMLTASRTTFLVWIIVWGVTVVGDSPQFSALTAVYAPRGAVGSVLTLSNCIGFAISMISIAFFTHLVHQFSLPLILPWLAIGPFAGLVMLSPLLRRTPIVQLQTAQRKIEPD